MVSLFQSGALSAQYFTSGLNFANKSNCQILTCGVQFKTGNDLYRIYEAA